MRLEKAPAAAAEVPGPPHVAETDRYNLGVAPGGAGIDAVAGDRVERPQIHNVVPRLEIDPADLAGDRQPAQAVAEPLRLLVEPDDRKIGADGQQPYRAAVFAERGIARQRPVDDVNGEEGAGRVADHDDLAGAARLDGIDEIAGEQIHARLPVGAPAVRELPGRDDVVAEIEKIGVLFGGVQREGKGGEADARADEVAEP